MYKLFDTAPEEKTGYLFEGFNGDENVYVYEDRSGRYVSPFVIKAADDSMMPFIHSRDNLIFSDEYNCIKDAPNEKPVLVCYKKRRDNKMSQVVRLMRKVPGGVLLYAYNSRLAPSLVLNDSDVVKIYKLVKIIRNVD